MSADIPKAAIVFGAITPPQGDLIKAKIHLGCTTEVSSFEVVLENWDKKYSPGGTYPITVGLDGHIDIGRGLNVPQLITCRVESIKYECPSPDEHYLRVEGRCWGEKLFRRVVTQKWTGQKGEAVVKDLMDSFAGLSHTRSGTELVEDTDTTFNSLEYEDAPLWDVLKYIAESSDKAGTIGYDFRVAPDGKFEFFPKNSKTSSVSLAEMLEVSEYRKDIHRIRNKIMVYGLADKSVPLDKDAWTESLTPTDGAWSAPTGTVSLDGTVKIKGSYSIKCYNIQAYYASGMFTLNSGKEVNTNLYPALSFYAVLEKAFSGDVSVALYDINGLDAWKHITIGPGAWRKTDLKVGLANELEWDTVQSGFDWSQVKKVRVDLWFAGVGEGSAWIDALYFGGRRYAAVREDSASQAAYGLRELTETDEELVSDNECDLRARALLDFFKSPAEYIVVRSTILDYGTTPILTADKISLELPNENISGDYRVETAEYTLDTETQTLEVALELGKVPPMIADYLYGLRTTTVNVEKLARTKLGKRGIPSVSYGGGLGSHHVGHERGSDAGAEWPTAQDGGWDPLTGWISPSWIGPYSNSAAIMKFRTRNKAGSVSLDHHLEPSDNEYGILGSESAHWKEIHALYSLLYGYLRIRVAGQTNPKTQLDDSMLQFGPGSSSALDTWLKRVGAGQLELKTDLLPVADNSGNLGSADKRFGHVHAANYHFEHLVPDLDDTYDLGESVTPKRWRDLYLAGAIKALADGVAVHLLPNADNTYNLGASGTRWGNLYLAGLGEIGWLNISGTLVISNARVLQNVTADAGIITSGQFALARMPRGDAGTYLRAYGATFDPMYAAIPAGDVPDLPASKITSGKFGLGLLPLGTSGYVLEGEGGADPMYVDPNGRYTPAAHTHSHGSLTGVGPNDHHAQSHNHAGEALSPSSISVNTLSVAVSVNCANWVKSGDYIFGNDFRVTESEKVGLPKGLAFLSPKGKIVMFLDCSGNVEIFGRLSQNRRSKRLKRKRVKA